MPRFNPATGEWEGLAPPSLGYVNRSTSQTFNYDHPGMTVERPKPSLFRRFDSFIIDIGNFFARITAYRDNVTTILTWIGIAFGVLLAGFLYITGHWIVATLLIVFAGYLFVAITGIIALLMAWVMFVPVAVLRYVFYNAASFIAVVVFAGAVWMLSQYSNRLFDSHADASTVVETQAQTYYCTARSLWVRSEPTMNSQPVGKLHQGDAVEVLDIFSENDFAAISYNGTTCYVSRRYISKDRPD